MCRVRTTDRADHGKVRMALKELCPMDPDLYGWPRGVQETKPKRTIVQRRIEMALAHELTDAARESVGREWCEASLSGTSWHACIRAPEPGADSRDFVASIVYTPFALERLCDGMGQATSRWTFERESRLPTPAPFVRVLMGNGPEKGRGGDELIRSWRRSLATIQNRHLTEAGSRRCYGPRPYRARGMPTGRPEEAPAALPFDAPEGQVDSADVGWGTVERLVETMSGNGGSSGGDTDLERERRTIAMRELRVLAGARVEEAEHPDKISDLWELLDLRSQHAKKFPVPPSEVVRWLWSLPWAFSALRPSERWHEPWRRAVREDPDEHIVAMIAAAIVGRWADEEKARYEFDPRPEVRALLAWTRRWEAMSRPWRERLRAIREETPTDIERQAEGAEGILDELRAQGMSSPAILTPEEQEWIERVREQREILAASRQAADAMRRCTDRKAIERAYREWKSRHEDDLAELGEARACRGAGGGAGILGHSGMDCMA